MIQYLQYVKFRIKVIEKKEESCEYQKCIFYEKASGGNAFGSPCNRHAARHGFGISADKGNVTINGGTVVAEGKGPSGNGIFAEGDVKIKGGKVTATGFGNGSCGIRNYSDDMMIDGGNVSIKGDGEGSIGVFNELIINDGDVTVTGADYALHDRVKNAIAGTGWSTAIPKGTDAGDYCVWYKAAGDRAHVDSKTDFVIVTIKEGPKPDPEPTPAKVSGTLMAKMTAKGKEYEAYVKAYVMKDGKKKYVKESPIFHAYTGKGTKKFTNAKAVKVNKAKVTLKKGKTFKIKAKVTKVKKNKKLMPSKHVAKLRYLTTNKNIATVSKKGKIKAKSKGKCYVYAYAHNGVSKKIKVTVK